MKRGFAVALGPACFLAFALLPSPLHDFESYGSRPAYAAGIALWMAAWWFTEAVPIGWTSLIPLLGYPVMGVYGRGPVGDVVLATQPFFDAYIFLFLGGMAIGAAMEHWNLHRRIALHVCLRVGAEPKRLLWGMLLATAGISLWISNTATAVMMMPIALAVLRQVEAHEGRRSEAFGTALLLSVAYAANVGGMGTKIGTATNSIFVGHLSKSLGREMSFFEFLAVGLPFVALFLPVVWAALWWHGQRDAPKNSAAREVLEAQLSALGAMSRAEKVTALVFTLAALLWILSDVLRPLLGQALGSQILGKHYEATVAMGAAVLLGLAGALPWGAVRRIPLSALLLLGGSFAMAAGIEGSGLSTWLGHEVKPLSTLSPLWQFGLSTAATIGLSAVASNTATVNLMLNLLPKSVPLLSTVALAASCDFALPAGTPPNAIVFGSGAVRLPVMIRLGAGLDLAAAMLLTLYGATYLTWLLE